MLTEKSINGEQEVKARLVARGYEEQQLTQIDSPTCTKEVFRLVVTILASKGWKIHSLDIKSAFLQGKKIERDVYITSPKGIKLEGFVWKLNTCVYGLNDASKTWYFSMRDGLVKLGVKPSLYNSALFYW